MNLSSTEQNNKPEMSQHDFEVLFRSYYEGLVRFIWANVKSKAIAEELVQELFLKVWENPSIIDKARCVKSYLFQAARNMSLDFLKHQEVEHDWEKESQADYNEGLYEIDYDKALHNKLLLEEIEKTIQALPERRRLVFMLSRYEGMSYKEIGQVLNISENTVETHIRRTLIKLKEKFGTLVF